MLESDFRARLLEAMRRRGWHANAIETGDVCPGFPDTEWCAPNIYACGSPNERVSTSGLTELKVAKGNRVKFEKFQPVWHVRRHNAGGVSTILVVSPRIRAPGLHVFGYLGQDVLLLQEQGLKLKARWGGQMESALDWLLQVHA